MATTTESKPKPRNASTRQTTKRKALLREAGLSVNAELTAEQQQRLDDLIAADRPASLTGGKLAKAIMDGAGAKPNGAGSTRKRSSSATKRQEELGDSAFELAGAGGSPLSQRVRGVEVAKIEKALAKLDGETVPAKLAISERNLRRFVAGRMPRAELPAESKAAIAAFTRAVADHQIWARKAAAAALAVHEREITTGGE